MSRSTVASDISSVDADKESGYTAFSRSPESKNYGASTSYYTPRKGDLYHMDAKCPVLRLKKLGEVHGSIPKGFEPCMLCENYERTTSTLYDSSPVHEEQKEPETSSKEAVLEPKSPPLSERVVTLSFGSRKEESHTDSKDSVSPIRVTSTASSNSVSSPEVEFVTTRTGRFYHQDPQCYNLRSATKKFFVTRVRADLDPCYLCVSDDAPLEISSNNTRSTSTTAGSVTATKLSKPLITTRTGRFYHSDSNCENLRSAKRKIPVYAVPTNLDPCYKCVESSPAPQTASAGLSRGVAETASSTQECGRYITTRTGRFYHLDYNCYNLRSAKAKFRKQTAPAGLLPCYKCA